ncbi:nnp-1 protein putative nuclear protein 1 nop52 [Anaeramoeba flamelloides]|uniref:Nnp-1 protein putative nuclear protein 1 nop52 n=1 Tax=Anaeramoeba flamelloides TaxID=1746091 RepID=A0ABQ8X7X8_9EUKA|nr:nnp-1 protein putative nuclear protein 1 nop52 [Anaeramoeba flamelloides]
MKPPISLLRKLAEIYKMNNEYLKSLTYYMLILDEYKLMKKNNEIIFVSEVISSMLLEKGEFKAAEKYLNEALNYINPFSKEQSLNYLFNLNKDNNDITNSIDNNNSNNNSEKKKQKLNSKFLNIQLKIIKIYLQSINIERAIVLLEDILETNLTARQKTQFLELLIQAYLKKGWFKEAWSMLKKLEESITNSQKIRLNRYDIFSLFRENIDFIELTFNICCNIGYIGDALYWVNCLINLTNKDNLGSKGKYYYWKGKCLQRLCNPKILNHFPLKIKLSFDPKTETRFNLAIPIPTYNVKVFSNMGELINEIIYVYFNSSNYFELAGNEYRKSKALTRLVETLLEYCFPLVALLNYKFKEIGKLPKFEKDFSTQDSTFKKTQTIKISSSRRTRHNSQNKSKGKIKNTSIKINNRNSYKNQIKNGELYENSNIITNNKNNILHNLYKKLLKKNKKNQKLNEKLLSLKVIEQISDIAVGISSKYLDPLLLLRSYLNIAEISFLLNDKYQSKLYFDQCKTYFYKLFMADCNKFILNKNTPCLYLEKIYKILKRLVRVLFSFDNGYINENLFLIETKINFELFYEISQGVRVDSIESILGKNSNIIESKKSKMKREKRKQQYIKKFNGNKHKNKYFKIKKKKIPRRHSSPEPSSNKNKNNKNNNDNDNDNNINMKNNNNNNNNNNNRNNNNNKSINEMQPNIDLFKINQKNRGLWRRSVRMLVSAELNNQIKLLKNENDNNVQKSENSKLKTENIIKTTTAKVVNNAFLDKYNEQIQTGFSKIINNNNDSDNKQETSTEKIWALLYRIKLNLSQDNVTRNQKNIQNNSRINSISSYQDLLAYFNFLKSNKDNNNDNNNNNNTQKDDNEEMKNIFKLTNNETNSDPQNQYLKILKKHSFFNKEEWKLYQFLIEQHQGNHQQNYLNINFTDLKFSKFTFKNPKSFIKSFQMKDELDLNNNNNNDDDDDENDDNDEDDDGDDDDDEDDDDDDDEIGKSKKKVTNNTNNNDNSDNNDNNDNINNNLKNITTKNRNKKNSSSFLTKQQLQSNPIILVLSKWLKIFPWENMFKQTVIRTQDMFHLVFLPKAEKKLIESQKNLSKYNKKFVNFNKIVPRIFVFYSSPELYKQVSKQEYEKKKMIFSKLKFQLNHSNNFSDNLNCRELQNSPPFHSPLVKWHSFPNKGKFKNISFIETQLFLEFPTRLPKIIHNALNPNEYPIILLSILDILDMSEAVYYLFVYKWNYCFLFMEENKILDVAVFLKKEQKNYYKICKKKKFVNSPYHFLISTIEKIRNDLKIPIFVYSPPRSAIF